MIIVHARTQIRHGPLFCAKIYFSFIVGSSGILQLGGLTARGFDTRFSVSHSKVSVTIVP